MTIRYEHLKQRHFEPVRQHYGERDTMLYALSLGLGSDPLCPNALPFFYEASWASRPWPPCCTNSNAARAATDWKPCA